MNSKEQSKVSVVITCYNYGKFVQRAVNSVIAQTYKNVEIIIINDGSTDDTDDRIKELIKKHSAIEYVAQENRGIIKTRNLGLQLSRGEYILQLDADDHIPRNYINSLVTKAKETDADIVYTDYVMFGDKTERSNFPEYDFEILKNRNYINVSCLVKKSCIGNQTFDEKLTNLSHEDWDFFLGLCASGSRAVKCSETALNYRIHTGARNNQMNELEEQRKFIDTYCYVISKYAKSYPNDFAYLIGGTFAHWYQDLDDRVNSCDRLAKELTQNLSYQKNETLQLAQELALIRTSKSYRIIMKLHSIKHRLTMR